MKFLDLVKARYSVRQFQNRPVEQEKLDYLLECMRFAPSAVNFQPWRFRVVTDRETLELVASCYNRDWLLTAPCIIVACADHDESWHRPSDNKDFADVDAAIAIEHIHLAAAEQGLGSCWVCNFDAARCHEILSLPESVEPIALIPLGYAADAPREKKRKCLEDIVGSDADEFESRHPMKKREVGI